MDRKIILAKVVEIVVGELGAKEEEVKEESSFIKDLGADSLDIVELIMKFEEVFGKDGKELDIPDEEAEKLTTVGKAVDYLAGLTLD
jgi:acyl carrier protein